MASQQEEPQVVIVCPKWDERKPRVKRTPEMWDMSTWNGQYGVLQDIIIIIVIVFYFYFFFFLIIIIIIVLSVSYMPGLRCL
jgi:hypothetical protein